MATACIVDGTKAKRPFSKTTFAMHGFNVVTCPACELKYVDISDDALSLILKRYYEGAYDKRTSEKSTALSRFRKSVASITGMDLAISESQARFMERSGLIQSNNIIDLGCGQGKLLIFLERRGYEVGGVEPDPERARVGQQQLKRDVVKIGTIDNPENYDVDVIIISHVLEHLTRPDKFLRLLKKRNPEAKLFVEVPNCANPEGLKASMSEPHNYHFNARNLKALLENCGWKVKRTETCAANGYYWAHILWFLLRKDVCPRKENGFLLRLMAE